MAKINRKFVAAFGAAVVAMSAGAANAQSASAAEAQAHAAAAAAAEARAQQEQAQKQAQKQEQSSVNQNANALEARTGDNTFKAPSVTAGVGLVLSLSPDDFASRQQMTGDKVCHNGNMYLVTQGDSAFGANKAEAIGIKIELSPAEKRQRAAEAKAAKKAGDRAKYDALRSAPVAACDEVIEPNFPQPAVTPVQSVTYNVTINEVRAILPQPAPLAAAPLPQPRRAVRRPVKAPAKPKCEQAVAKADQICKVEIPGSSVDLTRPTAPARSTAPAAVAAPK